MQENEIDICEEILKDVANVLNEFPEVSEFNFTAENHILISVPISSTNLFFQLTHQFKDGPKKKRAKSEKSEKNTKKYAVLPPCKES